MANGAITDEQISASSTFDPGHYATYGRLFYTSGTAAWVTSQSDPDPWFQIDLRNHHTKVTRVATQGRSSSSYCCQWVTKYNLQFSTSGTHFSYYKERGQNTIKVTYVKIMHGWTIYSNSSST